MLPEDSFFWIKGEDGGEYGPVGLQELRGWVQENRAGIGTDVRRDEPGARWTPWQNHPELIALLAEAQVTCPIPGLPGLALASLAKRAGAFAFDLILVSILATPLLIALAFAYMPGWVVQFELAFIRPELHAPPGMETLQRLGALFTDPLLIAYFAGFIAAHGQTPAKAFFRVRVVDAQGNKPGFARALVRAMVVFLSMGLLFFPFLYVFMNPQRRALHDYVAGTFVVEA